MRSGSNLVSIFCPLSAEAFAFSMPGVGLAAMKAVYVPSICLLNFSVPATEKEATLKVGAKSYAVSELLKRPEIETITVKHDPAYGGQEMRYRAIGAAALFAETNLRDDEVVQLRCRDGFVATISKERIMRTGPGQSRAYIART